VRQARNSVSAFAAILILVLAGCAKNPGIPTPPQVQVANSINALAQSLDAATSGLIAARDQGKLSQSDLTIAFKVITSIAVTGKQLDAELRSTDSWAVQVTKMRQIIVASGVSAITPSLPANARAVILAALTTFNSISSSLGGPLL
jgi:hypothetical protein